MSPVDASTLKKSHQKVLRTLLDNGGTLNNNQLKEFGCPGGLTGKDNEHLVALGLIETERRRVLVHTLTPGGREVASAATVPTPPPIASTKPTSELKPNQILALVVLMAEAREMTNKELAELAGFSLTGADNTALEKSGLVATDRTRRTLSHQLTDKGWHVARTLHESAPPKEGGSAVQSLFTLLANVHRALERLQIGHGDFFKQTGARQPSVGRSVEQAVRDAYRELADPPGAWVGLADLRDRLEGLAGLDRGAVDDTLRAMVRQPGVRVIPVANAKALSQRDRAAAVRIGHEDKHTLSIGTP